jgi:predicted SAM-dependent methyltransferase
VDMDSYNKEVISSNLLKNFPFHDEEFEVLYHSNVLEHFPYDKAPGFIKECYRVLKQDGVIRIVVPDLENIVDEYKKCLNEVLRNPSKETEANYDWIMMELFDQTVRNYSGGNMLKFYQQETMVNEQYVINRIGHVASSVRAKVKSGIKETYIDQARELGFIASSKIVLNKVLSLILGEKYKVGQFRMTGEIHMWMYDRYSLSRILKNSGFRDIKIKNAFESDIPNWSSYELDVKEGIAYDPISLFIEAKK